MVEQKGKTPFRSAPTTTILPIMRHKTGNGRAVKLEQFLEDIKAVVQDGEELLKGGATGIKDKALAGVQSTDRVIRDHPYETLGIVFGVGFIAGLLTAGALIRKATPEPVE